MIFAVAVRRRAWGYLPIGGGDVAGNRAFEVIDRSKDAPFEALPSGLEKKPVRGIEPEPAAVGVKWNVRSRMLRASQAST